MSPQVLPAAGIPPSQQQPHQQQAAAAISGVTGSNGTPGGQGSNAAVLELVDGFLAVQRERAGAYRRFDAAFRAFLQSKAEGIYR
jgi:hypothetical protein